MKKKFLVSVLLSLGIVVLGVGMAYAAWTFKANQEGFRQGGAAQATHVTIRVEAGMADPNSDFVPDDGNANLTSPGGALTFAIENTSNVPLAVTQIDVVNVQSTTCGGTVCPLISSNKNGTGAFVAGGNGDCKQWASITPPSSYLNWPIIAPHSTLQVNGTDNNRLGAGMIHLSSSTAQGCQGATFGVNLKVTAYELTRQPGSQVEP
ncbi:MAG: hypothetical protein E6I60_07850 [Chloroflexi bacterium]|nr:MAG: hypothetical protein E6I60_07850 [Chloroflexota bacterium]